MMKRDLDPGAIRPMLALPQAPSVLSRAGWSAIALAVVVVGVVVPLLNLAVPADSAFHLSDYAVQLTARSCAMPSRRSRWT